MAVEPAFQAQSEGGGRGNMALTRKSSSESEANLISENEPDDHFEDEPDLCLDEEEEIELALSAPSDDQ